MHYIFLAQNNLLLLDKILIEQRKVLKINTISTYKHLVFDKHKVIKDNNIGLKAAYKNITIKIVFLIKTTVEL